MFPPAEWKDHIVQEKWDGVQKSIIQIMRVNYPRSESAFGLPKQSWKEALRDKADVRRLTACQNKPDTFTEPSTHKRESANALPSITGNAEKNEL